ncbi:hypothetical protein TA3x_000472 [Tundrisphaera sp. TA3]|uniref:hypothetical protein n=1 Tax=Tundrisphaera sp. TA3 TaxID=3435775 RepID=UPI003EBFA4B9
MPITLTLGDVSFRGFEIPESIDFGGEQALVVHKLPGGARTIDAMGRDDREIPWSGRFRGFDAESRAKQLDAYRIAGEPLTLTWGGFRYRVVVRSFEAKFHQPFEITYSITVCVAGDDLNPPPPPPALSDDQIVDNDLQTCSEISEDIDDPEVKASVGKLSRNTNPDFSTFDANMKAYTTNLALTATGESQARTESSLPGLGSFLPGGDPQDIAAGLGSLAHGFDQLKDVHQLKSVLGQAAKNLAVSIGPIKTTTYGG